MDRENTDRKTAGSPNPVLAQKIGLTVGESLLGDAEKPASAMRLMRRALGRAADNAVSLSASVLGIAQEDAEAEDLIESGPEGWVVLGLRDATSAGLTGVFLLDPALRSSLVEIQTMGNLLPRSELQRPVTRTDAIMTMPFADQLLKELSEVGFGEGELEPASYDMGPMEDLRTAGLVMMQGVYRIWQVTIQIGGGECQGEMLIALRPKPRETETPAVVTTDWSAALKHAVSQAPADLDAVLTRMTLPISKIDAFEVGHILQLAGTTVGSVTLTGSAGQSLATARLGQVAGKRAVRVEPLDVQLQEDTSRDRSRTGASGPVNMNEVLPEPPINAPEPELLET